MKLFTVLFLLSLPAVADDVGFNQGSHLVFHMVSRHSGKQDLNESNPGISYRHGIDRLSVFVVSGFYRNSYDKTSVYAGIGKTFFSVGPIAFTLIGGTATGYVERITPALIPEASFHYKKASFLVGYIPGVRYNNATTTPAFTFSVSASF